MRYESWNIDEPWIDLGECRNHPPEVFFPAPGGDERTGLAVCAQCPVQNPCLDYALRANERWGIWGGMTQRARRRLSRARRRKAA